MPAPPAQGRAAQDPLPAGTTGTPAVGLFDFRGGIAPGGHQRPTQGAVQHDGLLRSGVGGSVSSSPNPLERWAIASTWAERCRARSRLASRNGQGAQARLRVVLRQQLGSRRDRKALGHHLRRALVILLSRAPEQ